MSTDAKRECAITMTAPMVRALLDGRKSKARRIVKPQPVRLEDGIPIRSVYDRVAKAIVGTAIQRCPYGKRGDRLWVKETWAEEHPLAIQEGRYSQPGRAGIPGPPGVTYRVIYRADGEPLQVWRNANQRYPYFTRSGPASDVDAEYPTVCSNYHRQGKGIYWCSLQNMPRWAGRITLELTGVRVELLQEISEADAIAEGLRPALGGGTGRGPGFKWNGVGYEGARAGFFHVADADTGRCHCKLAGPTPAQCAYRDLWESINGPGSWNANPWVWALEFQRIGTC